MFCRTGAGHASFWRVGIARNDAKCYVFPKFRGFKGSQSQLRKARWCEGSAGKDVDKICTTPARESDLEVKLSLKTGRLGYWAKFAPRLRARAIQKSKSSKSGMAGALLEVEVRKNCTTPARKSDSEVKIVKN